MDLHSTYPALVDLKARARRRVPKFVWEYLDSGTGDERTKAANRAALDRLEFLPSILHGALEYDLGTSLLGFDYKMPVGIAPVGMSGLIWPGAERALAACAARHGLPYTLSTVAAAAPEDVADVIGEQAWFQLYPPKAVEIRTDMLARVKAAGFKALVLTVDLPAPSRRERQTRSGLTSPPRLTPRLLAQVMMRPAWALATAQAGQPRMRTLDKYIEGTGRESLPPTEHVGYLLRAYPDWDYLRWIRDAWDGPLIVKGVLRAEDAPKLKDEGVDALWGSNHAGRQFDGAPGAIDCLAEIRAATDLPIIFDSGVEGGLDILRALALGADFVMMGRAWHFALAALGPETGPDHLAEILQRDVLANLGQLGVRCPSEMPKPL
jgi:L-lactate dehydrogenase (cytochrome)